MPFPLVCCLLVSCLLASCGAVGDGGARREAGLAASQPALYQWHGELALEDVVAVVPDRRWREHPDGEGWFFGSRAEMLVLVREAQQDLQLRLVPDAPTSERHYTVRWNGVDLFSEPVQPPAQGLVLTLTPQQLSAGVHRLSLERVYRRHPDAKVRGHDNGFRSLTWIYGNDPEKALQLQDSERYNRISDFLLRGGTGSEREQHDGLLMVGATEHPLRLPAPLSGPGPHHFVAKVHNLSSDAAYFLVGGRGGGDEMERIKVPSGQLAELKLPLAQQQDELLLKVDGEQDGLFLWGLPRVESPLGDRLPKADGATTQTASGADDGDLAARSLPSGSPLPPIVLITLDTTRRDALGVYGGPEELTPMLDEMAAQATVYEDAYSTSPWTLPSHASIFTGLYPSRHRAGVSEAQLAPERPTMARLLRDRGYLSAGFSSGELSSSRFGLANGFSYYRNPDDFETLGGKLAKYLDAFLDRYAQQPLFLFINYFDPHALYQAPEDFARRAGVREAARLLSGLPIWEQLSQGKGGAWQRVVDGEAQPSEAGDAFIQAAYHGEIAYTDHLVGQLFERLRQEGLYDPALIIVTADHGELLGEGGYYSHSGRLDPALVEIPLIVKWPHQSEGQRIPGLVSLVDLYPTVLEAVGIEAPESDGLTLRSGEGVPQRSVLFLEEHESLVHPLPPRLRVARHFFGLQRPSSRHLLWQEGEECARRVDGEWVSAPCTGDRDELLANIAARLQPPDPTAEGSSTEWMDPEMRRKLEALGYL